MVSFFLERSIQGFAMDNWSENQTLVINTLSKQIDNEISNAQTLLEYTATMPEFRKFLPIERLDRSVNGVPESLERNKRAVLNHLVAANAPFSVVFILLPNGDHYLSHPFKVQRSLKRYNLADRDYFRATTATHKTSVSNSFMGADGKLAVAINTPILNQDGELLGHLGGVLHLGDLSQMISAESIAPFDKAILMDSRGQLIAHSDPSKVEPKTRTEYMEQSGVQHWLNSIANRDSHDSITRNSLSSKGHNWISFANRLDAGWFLLLQRQENSILDEYQDHISDTTVFVALILLSVCGFGIWVSIILSGRWAHATLRLKHMNDSLELSVEDRTHELKQTQQQLELALQSSGLTMWDWQLKQDLFRVDDSWHQVLGQDESAPVPQTSEQWCELIHPDDQHQLQLMHTQSQLRHHVDATLRMKHQDGEWHWFECKGITASQNNSGVPDRLIGTLQDISERISTESQLRQSARVFEHAHEGIMITNSENRIISVNRAFTELTGYTPDEVTGHPPSILKSGHQSEMFYQRLWQDLNQQGYWKGEIWNRRKNGELFAEQLTITALKNDQGDTDQYIGIFSDVTHYKEQQNRLEQMAHYDALTNLPNRILLADRMEQALSHTKRMQNMLAVAYLDLDNFKPINDKLGHAIGDQLLIAVAQRLKEAVRGDDTISRLGGDEFVLLLPDQESAKQCSLTFDRIIARLAEPYYINSHKLSLSASIGISLYPLDDSDSDTLLRHADQAMYIAKQSGRNRYHYFDPSLEQAVKIQHDAQTEIQQALEQQQFVLHYQPKVDMRKRQVIGVEALIRWQHPERGLLFPDSFLPVIESSPLSITLGNWVIQEAVQQLAAWLEQGLQLNVSVNIAGIHLESESFIPDLQTCLKAAPELPANALELEILETSALEELDKVASIIKQCHTLGISVALDDFGTGYSSLTYFKRLPIDTVKIDRSFVIDMLNDEEDYTIVEGVIGLARAFQRNVIAEGVESVRHGEMLRALGCDLAQGYGIAKAMPAEHIKGWIKDYQAS